MKTLYFILFFSFLSTILYSSIINNPTVQTSNQSEMNSTAITDPDSRAYCPSTYTNQTDDYIGHVVFNTISNYSGQNGANSYGDYTHLSTDLHYGLAYFVSVYFYSNISVQHVWIFIDWNQDEDFDDSNESYDLGNGIDAELTYFIGVPPEALPGSTRVRVTEQYLEDPGPCDPHYNIYGETEDYTINISGTENFWTGAIDNNWHNPGNWYYNFIPDSSTDVHIQDVTNKCWVWAGQAYCNNLTVEYGSGNDLRIYDNTLKVSGDMDFYGQLLMDHVDGRLEVEGNVTWYSGSTASIQAFSLIIVYGDWTFQPGANVHLADGVVTFYGPGNSNIYSYEENCYFNYVTCAKSGGDVLNVDFSSTDDLYINEELNILTGCKMELNSHEKIYLQGNLQNFGEIVGTADGDLVFDGTDQAILTGASAFTNLGSITISSSIQTEIGGELSIMGSLTIESGQLVTNNFPISIVGDWDNQVGPAGFVEGTGRVTFIGQNWSFMYSNEDFYILEVAKTSSLGFIKIDGTIVTCQQYDWTSGGGISVRVGGEFTAYDLIDNGIYGSMWVDGISGTINLYNYDSFVDLNGSISMIGGVINVYGGTTISYWPYNSDGSITMIDGILDFHDQGIYIFDSPTYTLTENILGGTIRTAGGFWGESSSFSPDMGTIELYGTDDANIYTINGCYLNNVTINKSVEDINKTRLNLKSTVCIDERSGKMLGDGTRSNTLDMIDFLDINGNLMIESGVLNTNGNNIQIDGNWTNNVGIDGFMESTGTVFFDGNSAADITTNETFHNLIINKTYSDYNGLEILESMEVDVTGDVNIDNGTLKMTNYSKLKIDGNLFIANEAGLNAHAAGAEIHLGENWTNENSLNDYYQGFYGAGELVLFNGNTDQLLNTNSSEEYFTNLHINKSGGEFRPGRSIQVGRVFVLFNGDWQDQTGGFYHKFGGDIYIEPSGGYYPQELTTINGDDQTYQNYGGVAMFNDLIIDISGVFTLNTDLILPDNKSLLLDEGILDLNGNSFKALDVFINDGAELRVDDGAELSYVDGIQVNIGATLTAIGTSGNNATIRSETSGYSSFGIYNGGTISANYTDFFDLDADGVWVYDGAFVDPSNCFNNCNFMSGVSSATSSRLRIDNDQTLNINNINFFNNPYLAGASNISKTIDQGEIDITITSGDFTGSLYENDPYNRIHWSMGLPEIDDLTIQYNAGTNEIELNWTYPVPVDQFNIYRSIDPNDFSSADVFTTTTVGFSELATGTKYFYRVTAENITDDIEKE